MDDSIDDTETWAADKAVNVAQARALRAQAASAGLRFAAYLPPALATWVLDRVADGTYRDPPEAVYAIFGEHRDLEPHPDLRREIMARALRTAAADAHPASTATVGRPDRAMSDPAVWRVIPLP